jgi:Spy/CpxP family protein refolding chaperone
MKTLPFRHHLLGALSLVVVLAGSAAHAQVDTSEEPQASGESAAGTDAAPLSLKPREARMLREGRGMGMGRVAMRNGYPGPMHVLRHAEALELTEEQVGRTQSLRTRMHERAIEIGQLILAAEAGLDDLFETRPVDRVEMNARLQEIAGLRAQLRAVHLEAHLAQAEVLTPEQLEKIAGMEMREGRHGGEHDRRDQGRPEHKREQRHRHHKQSGDGKD